MTMPLTPSIFIAGISKMLRNNPAQSVRLQHCAVSAAAGRERWEST